MTSPLQRLIDREIGVVTDPVTNPLVTVIGTSSTQFLRNDQNRVAFLYVNLGANAVYIYNAASVSSSLGIRIPPNGGSIFMWWREDLHLVGMDWHGLAETSTSACLVIAMNVDSEVEV